MSWPLHIAWSSRLVVTFLDIPIDPDMASDIPTKADERNLDRKVRFLIVDVSHIEYKSTKPADGSLFGCRGVSCFTAMVHELFSDILNSKIYFTILPARCVFVLHTDLPLIGSVSFPSCDWNGQKASFNLLLTRSIATQLEPWNDLAWMIKTISRRGNGKSQPTKLDP